MTRERAKRLLPVITAWANGEEIEMVTKDCEGRPLYFRADSNARFDHCEWRIREMTETTKYAAPQWLVDMIRTGKPIRCNAWDDIQCKAKNELVYICGVKLDSTGIVFIDTNDLKWIHAEPTPAWKPKDGEAVLTRVFDHAETGYVKGGFIYVRNNRLAIEGAECKPFDESKLGWLWSEI